MNLASVSDQTNRIRFTQDWWLFLAVAGPLTLLTIGALTLAMMQEDKNKKHNASFEP